MSWPWKIALSLSWGLLLAGGAAYWTGATLLGFAWIYLYGDDPWPGYFDTVFLVVAAATAFLALGGVVAAFVLLPRISPWLDRRLQASAALRWAFLGLPLLLVAGAFWSLLQQEAAAERARAEAGLEDLRQAEAHRLAAAAWRLDPAAGLLRLDLTASGVAAGDYELRWQAQAPGLGEPVGSGGEPKALPAGPAALELELDAGALARRYAEAVLTRRETVEIDLPLSLDLFLVLQGAEPSDSHLSFAVPLSFRYGSDGEVTFAGSAAGKTP